MDAEPTTRVHTAPRSNVVQDQGSFRTRFNFPGRAVPGHDDHGYGPLSTVVESFMNPDTLISMHPHRNEEIVSWVPAGVMRHDDREGNDLVTDAENVLAMNAGSGFWHAEYTAPDDPPLRMLQIFVRPHGLGLDPGIQHAPLPDPVPGEWRRVFGPDGSDAPVTVRNAVDLYDVRLDANTSVDLPAEPGRDVYLYVFEGSVALNGSGADGVGADGAGADGVGADGAGTQGPGVGDERLSETESAVVEEGSAVTLNASEDAVLVAFLIDPDAPITRQGTIGR